MIPKAKNDKRLMDTFNYLKIVKIVNTPKSQELNPMKMSRFNTRLPPPWSFVCPGTAHYCSKSLEFIISNTHSTSFQEAGRQVVHTLLPAFEKCREMQGEGRQG